MIYMYEEPEKQEVSLYYFNDEIGFTVKSRYMKEQMEEYRNRGYKVHHYVYPDTVELKGEARERYFSCYENEGVLDRILDVGTYRFVEDALVQTVQQELAKYSADDIVESLLRYLIVHRENCKRECKE